MALKVSFKHPSLGDDVEVEIPGVGLVKNGGSRTLTEEDEQNFFGRTQQKVKDYYKDDGNFEVSGTSEAKLPSSTHTTQATPAGQAVAEKGDES